MRTNERAAPASRRPGYAVDWTTGSIPSNLLKLAWPMIVGSSLNMLGPTIDVIWVGRLGGAAVAGVGVAGIAVQMVMSAMMGMVTGMRALIARHIGAGEERAAINVAEQSMIMTATISAVLSVIGFFLARPVLLVLRLDPEVVSDGAAYLQIVFISVVPMFLRFMCEGSMQAAGDSVRPMIVTAIYRAVHIALCPFLIFGWWIFPELGIRGAAVTNIITQCLGLGLSLWIMLSGRTKLRFKFELPKLDFAAMGRIIKIGIPATVMGVQMSFGALILISLISPFGTAAVAAHTIWQRIDMVLMMPIMGLGMAAGVLAGQNLGANKPERATRSGWIAALLAEGFMLVAALLIYFIAESLVRLFNSDPELVRTGAAFLRIATVMYLFIAFMPVFQYCISGSGDTLPPMILSIVGTWVIMLPLAFILPKVTNWGVYGIRWAIVTNAFLGTAGFVVYFMSGRWKKKAV